MDVATFQRLFIEWRETDPLIVRGAIQRATRMVSPAVWGDKTDDGIALLAAHYLGSMHGGGSTKLEANKSTVYWAQFEELRRSVVGGAIGVAGGFYDCGPPWWER